MYSKVLVAVDLSHGGSADHMLELARLLVDSGGSITLLNVVQPLPSYIGMQAPAGVVEAHRKDTEEKLRALARSAGGEIKVVTALGNPGTEILDEADRLGADAIVVGSHRPGLSDYLIGSTAARVVRHAPCTVVVDRFGLTP
jgi:universal stress protein F